MRFGVLGTGFWAQEIHAASLAEHEDAELVGVWGRDLAKAKALGAPFEVAGYDDLDALLAQVDAVSFAVPPAVQVPLAVRAAEAGKHLLLEKPIALSLDDADRMVAAVRANGVASVVFFTFRFQQGTTTWLGQAARTRLMGGAGSWLGNLFEPGSPFKDSAWRAEKGALWDIGPHALSLFIPALGPVTAVQAGGGLGDTVHLVLHHEGGAASTVTLSHTVASMSSGIEFFVHGDAGRITLLPEAGPAARAAHSVAVEELTAAAVTGATSSCDVTFGRDVVAVLEAAARALASGCRELVAG
jgi:predicted dehydrogenase